MKIRRDFVTNSSSSSFIAFTINNSKLADLLEEYGLEINGDLDVSVDKDIVYGFLGNDEGIDTAEISEEGLVAFLISMLTYLDDRYGTEQYQELIELLQENEFEINNELVSADIKDTESVTDGSGSYYKHVIIENSTLKTTLLDEDSWPEDSDEMLWEIISNNTKDEAEMEQLAQSFGRTTTSEYHTKDPVRKSKEKYSQQARMIISLCNNLDSGQLDYVIKNLEEPGKRKILRTGNIGENIYFCCKKMNAYEEWLNDDRYSCYRYLLNLIYRYNFLRLIDANRINDEVIDFTNKSVYFQSFDNFYKYKNVLEVSGAKVVGSVSRKTEFAVIEDDYWDDGFFINEKIRAAVESAVKGYGLKFMTSSDFERYAKGLTVDEDKLKEMRMIDAQKHIDAMNCFRDSINTVSSIECNNLAYVTTFLEPDEEDLVRGILVPLGATEKGAMSRKVGLIILKDRYTEGNKTGMAVYLIEKYGHHPIVITYDFFLEMYDKGQIMRGGGE